MGVEAPGREDGIGVEALHPRVQDAKSLLTSPLPLWRPPSPPGAALALLATILHTNGTALRLGCDGRVARAPSRVHLGTRTLHALLSAHPSQALDAVFIPSHDRINHLRVCVKNIPKHCDERRLRQHFEADAPSR